MAEYRVFRDGFTASRRTNDRHPIAFVNNLSALWLLLITLSGCAWLVPDQEKDYLQARQLPPLRLPEAGQSHPTLEALKPPPAAPTKPPPPPLPAPRTGTAPYIELDQSFTDAWINVIKALNRQRLEIVYRDPEYGVLHFLHSEAETELAQDRGLWGDALYFFGKGEQLREREYRILLQPADGHIRLYLFDAEGRPLTDPRATALLERLRQSLTTTESP